MKIDFFKKACSETTAGDRFGICDPATNEPAFVKQTKEDTWIAVVENVSQKQITFTAIDNCIPIYKPSGDMESRCDGMLRYEKNIIFVELKNVKKRRNKLWIEEGIKQLKTTIQIFANNHDLSSFEKKRAFLANKAKPKFQYSHKEEMQAFKNELNIRLIIHNIIKV